MAPAFLLDGVFCSSLLKSATRSEPLMRALMRFGVVVVISLLGEVLGKEVGGAKAYPVFPIGPTGIHASIEPGFKVVVRSIDKGSPAEKSDLQAGDFIFRAEGVAIEGPDPRVALGKAIGLAEASDGFLDFGIVRAKDSSPLEKAILLYYEVRDRFLYDPFNIRIEGENLRATQLL